MATSGREVAKNANTLKRVMGIKGELQPGDLTLKARQIMAETPKQKTKLPPLHTKKGVAFRGLI